MEESQENKENSTNIDKNPSKFITPEDFIEYLEQKGVHIPQSLFLQEKFFAKPDDYLDEFTSYFSSIFTKSFTELQKDFIIINAKFLITNKSYKGVIKNICQNLFPYFMYSVGKKNSKEFIIIAKTIETINEMKQLNTDQFEEYLKILFLTKNNDAKARIEESKKNKEREDKMLEAQQVKEKDWGINPNESLIDISQSQNDLTLNEDLADLPKITPKINQFNNRLLDLKLPIIEKVNFQAITDNSTTIQVFKEKLTLKKIIEKNPELRYDLEHLPKDCKFNITALLNRENKIEKSVFNLSDLTDGSNGSDTDTNTSTSNIITLSNLQSDKLYAVKFYIELHIFKSTLSKPFLFFTKTKANLDHQFYAYGNNEDRNLFVNESTYDIEEFKEDFKNSTFEDINKISDENNEFLRVPLRLRNSFISSLSSFGRNSYLISEGKVYNSGCVYSYTDSEGVHDQFEEINGEIDIQESLTDPYLLDSFPKGCHFRKVVCGQDFALALGIYGEVYSWGGNLCGQLGLNLPSDSFVNKPRKIEFDNGNSFAIDVAVGHRHCLALVRTSKTKLYSWGYAQGQEPIIAKEITEYFNSPLNKIGNSSRPNAINIDASNIVKIIAGYNVSAYISLEQVNMDNVSNLSNVGSCKQWIRQIYTFGYSSYYQLGYENFFNQDFFNTPRLVDGFMHKDVIDISIGKKHSVFLVNEIRPIGDVIVDKKDKGLSAKIATPIDLPTVGTPYICGYITDINTHEYRKNDIKNLIVYPIPLGSENLYEDRSEDNTNYIGSDINATSPTNAIKNIVANKTKLVFAGLRYTLVVDIDNNIYAFGRIDDLCLVNNFKELFKANLNINGPKGKMVICDYFKKKGRDIISIIAPNNNFMVLCKQ